MHTDSESESDKEQVAPIGPMQPDAYRRLNRRRLSFTISISADSLIRVGLLLGGYLLLAGGYVLIGFAEGRGQE